MVLNVFFVLMELFTALYSDIPEHMHHFEYLFVGLEGETILVPWMCAARLSGRARADPADQPEDPNERNPGWPASRSSLAVDRQGPRHGRRRVCAHAARPRRAL